MKRKILIGFAAFIVACPAFAQGESSDAGFYMNFDYGYGFGNISGNPEITYNGLTCLIGLGYDFGGLISIDLLYDVLCVEGVNYTVDGYPNSQVYHAFNTNKDNFFGNMGLGADIGIKLVNDETFDLILPIGVLFRWNTLIIPQDNKKTFKHTYLNLETGLIPSFRIGNIGTLFGEGGLYLTLPFYIGYPVYKKLDVTNCTNPNFDSVISFSIGVCLKILIPT